MFFMVVPLLLLAGCLDFTFEGASPKFIAADSNSRPGACNFPAIFNFGDSNSDTGGLVAGLGLRSVLPNGETFFHKPTGRYCNGRLVIDFLCEAMNMTLLSPYLESVGSDFRHGSNFAIAGATVNATATPFPLPVQVNQFNRFRARVVDIFSQGGPATANLPQPDAFDKALYTLDIGQNDITHAFLANLTESQINSGIIPQIINNLISQLKYLYQQGARNFVVHNTGPLGCLPRTLADIRRDLSELDEHGCAVAYNRACQTFNLHLKNECQKLRTQFSDATIVYVDIYSIKYDLIANATQYGFEHPLAACCGYGGLPYNYYDKLRCGATGVVNGKNVTAGACKDPTKYVSWDGIHYSETANSHIWSRAMSAQYSEHALSPIQACRPDSERK
eukprot:PITA_30857